MGASPVTSGQLARRFVASPGVTMPCSTSGVLVDSLKSARRPGSTPSGVETLCEMQVGVPWAFPAPMAPKRCRSRALYDLQNRRRGVREDADPEACVWARGRVDRRVRLVWAWLVLPYVCAWFGVCMRAKYGGGGGGGRVVRWRVAAHSLSSLPGHAESPVATRGCELSPVVASPVVASPVVASARPSLKPRASKATSGVKVGGGAALSCGEMVDWWSTTWLGLGLGLGVRVRLG